jgi:hypothetical protein
VLAGTIPDVLGPQYRDFEEIAGLPTAKMLNVG